jgi:hypothetical protein
MIAISIGISIGLLTVIFIATLKRLDKETIYGLILSAIGVLYVGYTWTDTLSLIITIIQAVIFMFIAYFGIRKNISILAAGYFLHGLWDVAYSLFRLPNLIPPHYDLFCLSIDFTMGICLVICQYRLSKNRLASKIQ